MSEAAATPSIISQVEAAKHLAILGRHERSANFGSLAPEEKELYAAARRFVKQVVDDAHVVNLGRLPARAHTSHVCPSGRTTNNYWSCVYPAVVPHKSYGLQIALILSLRGIEICCCLGAGETETRSIEERQRLTSALAAVKGNLLQLPEEVRSTLRMSLGGWHYREQWRLEPGQDDFKSIDDWLSFAGNADSRGASISKYFAPDALPTTDQLVGEFQQAVSLFGPLFDAAYPAPTIAQPVEPDGDGLEWLDVMKEYQREQAILLSPVKAARYYVKNIENASVEVKRLDAPESEKATAFLFSERLGRVREAGRLPIAELDGTAAKRTLFLHGPTICMTSDRSQVVSLEDHDDVLENFIEAIRDLNVDRSGGEPKLYKPIMLMAAIQAMTRDKPVNRVTFDEGVAGFTAIAKRLAIEVGLTQATYAYRNLCREPFWVLCAKDPVAFVTQSSDTAQSIRETISHAMLRRPYFNVIADPTRREIVLNAIEETWFDAKRTVPSTDLSSRSDPSKRDRRYWALGAGEGGNHWQEFQEAGIAAMGCDKLGDFLKYPDKAAIEAALTKFRGEGPRPVNDALACWEFSREMQPGDYVVAKIGMQTVLGVGEVEGEYRYDESRSEYKNTRKVRWLRASKMQVPDGARVPNKALTDVTNFEAFVSFVEENLLSEVLPPAIVGPVGPAKPFSVDDAMRGLFMPRDRVDALLKAIKRKKNVILQGPPGVGKTFVAKRLAYALMGAEDRTRVEAIQFHQSYAYEDFIQGWRPDGKGFRLRPGVFYELCRTAEKHGEPHVLIIDEINRGNLSRIFGELLMLIEADYRGPDHAIPLTYSATRFERFHVPENLFIVGLMNTADRSLAMVDYALRRRFAFFALEPHFESNGFSEALTSAGISTSLLDRIREKMKSLNNAISQDKDLGPGFRIGHSYFCPRGRVENGEEWYSEVVNDEVAPLLREYWFDNGSEAERRVQDLLA